MHLHGYQQVININLSYIKWLCYSIIPNNKTSYNTNQTKN